MEERFTTKKTDIANAAFVQNVQCAIEVISIDPKQVQGCHFATDKVAEIKDCIVGVHNGDITEQGATADEPQYSESLWDCRAYQTWLCQSTEI